MVLKRGGGGGGGGGGVGGGGGGKQDHFTNDDRIPQVNTKPPLNNAINVYFM